MCGPYSHSSFISDATVAQIRSNGRTENGSSMVTPISSTPRVSKDIATVRGTMPQPHESHKANGKRLSQTIIKRDVCRVYERGMGVFKIRSHEPHTSSSWVMFDSIFASTAVDSGLRSLSHCSNKQGNDLHGVHRLVPYTHQILQFRFMQYF